MIIIQSFRDTFRPLFGCKGNWLLGFFGCRGGIAASLVGGNLCTRNRSFLDTLPHFWLLETQFVYLSDATTYSPRLFATVGSSQNRVRI